MGNCIGCLATEKDPINDPSYASNNPYANIDSLDDLEFENLLQSQEGGDESVAFLSRRNSSTLINSPNLPKRSSSFLFFRKFQMPTTDTEVQQKEEPEASVFGDEFVINDDQSEITVLKEEHILTVGELIDEQIQKNREHETNKPGLPESEDEEIEINSDVILKTDNVENDSDKASESSIYRSGIVSPELQLDFDTASLSLYDALANVKVSNEEE